ncbi:MULTISPECIES: DUF3784 domain-containing protein [unclassified Bacillus (in: firmicutes)]|uniref:DUF3784 domain-containing protein n=1 Tax=unclassified Bacillus (in: firmicutes) TaxID=185979 RepID=UPI0008ED6BEB|nr:MULTISPECIES: DUF3784 domain-containing protein [unclassified Bacillus (in: firmicutes)]SFB07201.1 PH domain-containing protein [Bacillus sp. UNCCL13]SFQ87430.1 PH domain-containing protein [Bacillus sp. cl95]
MWFMFGVQIFIILLFFILGWAIRYRKAYWLISNFASRPEVEKQQLLANGYPQKTGTLLMATAIGMLLMLPLTFTTFKFAMEAQFGFLIVFLMGGFIYLIKYELPHKRKSNYTISSLIFVAVIAFITVLSYQGYQKSDLITKKNTFEITGMYGKEWNYDDIQNVELMEKMPEVTWKQNGFGTAGIAKGYFKVTGYGSSLLFIEKGNAPYLYIKMDGKDIFINSDDASETQKWYETLQNKQ